MKILNLFSVKMALFMAIIALFLYGARLLILI